MVLKFIIRDPKIISIITDTLSNVQGDYAIGDSEWDNGTRSDIVLEAKSPTLELFPIIIEIQHTVNSLFMKRVIGYSFQDFERYRLDHIVLIICTKTLSYCVLKNVKTRKLCGCYEFPSTGWASNCFFLFQTRVVEYANILPLDLSIALGLFMTSRAKTINEATCADDPKVQYLYTLALKMYQNRVENQHIADILVKVLETQEDQHNRILDMLDKDVPT
ncbi:hypothetical protein CLU79DRAFT_710911 [Phycomyces nitens]|nr:hypothetical protein CLU79DRAFT_710911 [Phycomyces nitens]